MKKMMLLVGALSASMVWAENVSYRYYDTAEKTFKTASANCTVVTSATREFSNGGWYAVTEDVTIADANITVNGSAHLILCDGKTLTVTNVPDEHAAIGVAVVDGVTNSLSIYGQAAGTGGLNAFGGYGGSGIGGYYDGVASELLDGGKVRIDGGTVTAMGGTPLCMSDDGFAGICGGMVMINGGTVKAIGTDGSAGIGGYAGGDGGTVTINGGIVMAMGNEDGAGIGGGHYGNGGTVTINGGTVTATGGDGAAGIGGGYDGDGGTVTISGISPERSESPTGDGYQGCTVTATGGNGAAGIGGGYDGKGEAVTINGGTVTATGGDWAAGIGGGGDGDGGTVTISGGTVTATGGDWAAGIGGGYDGKGEAVTINGGAVATTGGKGGAGIGGGDGGDGGTVTINDGMVMAMAGVEAAGIGGGYNGAGCTVTISGGTVTATGGEDGAGIGGGYEGAGGTVIINDGSVTATGGDRAAGIGGGFGGIGGAVAINGGKVTAIGSDVGCAGIGGGMSENSEWGHITFCDDGTVEFGKNVGDDILAGANVAHSTIVTKEAYAQNHHAMYVTMPAAVVRVPQVAGITYSVSNGTGEVVGTLANCTNTYLVAPGDSLTVYFSLNPDCTYTKSTNPIVLSGIRGERTVDLADLPTARLPTVDYMDWDGNERVATSTASYMEYRGDVELSAGLTYVVKESRIATGRVKVNGTVKNPTRLILCDGVTLSATSGVEVNADGATTNALIICGQSNDMGKLMATGSEYAAGIGGGNRGAGGMVTINGGTVTATGCESGAGIGGGDWGNGGTVTINGGTVTAMGGGDDGAGIGGGCWGDGGTVTINGGTVTAVGRNQAAGIGGGYDGDGGTVTFGVGFVGCVLAGVDAEHASLLTADEYAQDHSAAYVAMPVAEVRIPRVAGVTYVLSNDTEEIAGVRMNCTNTYRVVDGDSLKLYFVLDPDCTYVQEPKANPMILGEVTGMMTIGLEDLPTVRVPAIAYLDWEDGKLVEKETTDYLEYRGDLALAGGVTYVVQKDMTVGFRIRVNGMVGNPTRLILCDGATLSATNGVEVSVSEDCAVTNALVIFGQAQVDGTLVATNGGYCAGIGGGYEGAGGTVTINGGIVMATGGKGGAGIGGGDEGAGGTVTINGGIVMAMGNEDGAGIGGGHDGDGGTVTINGGIVMATGGEDDGAGIGGGYGGDGGTVTISGGTVTARGAKYGAGIGGGYGGDGGTVTISGGKITAYGGEYGESVGHGYYATDSGTVMVSGGLFWGEPEDRWIAGGCVKIENADPETMEQYPWKVSVAVVEITIPTAVPGGSYVVSNLTTGAEIRPSGGQEGGATYLLLVGAHVAIYGVPSPGYVVVGQNPLDIPYVTLETTVDVADLPTIEHLKLEYIDADGSFKTNDTFEVMTADTTQLKFGHWYAVMGVVTGNYFNVDSKPAQHIILCDGAMLVETNGIGLISPRELNIYGQRAGTGKLVSFGSGVFAGIGSGNHNPSGTLTINGGIVEAFGNKLGGAGIGGGWTSPGGTLVVNGGIVTATGGGDGAAGIGGGGKTFDESGGTVGTVEINGGIVTAIGDGDGAGIGGGADKNGGTVKSGGSVKIRGGTVIAKGGTGMTNVRIDGGNVKATSTVDQDPISPAPQNSAKESVYEVKVELWGPDSGIEDQAMNVRGLGGYGTKDIVTIDGCLHLYLPSKDGKYEFTVGGMKYTATVENAGTTAAVVIITPLAPGYSSETYDSEVLAQTALVNGQISFAPASDVENVLEKSAILTVNGYKAMFTPVIYPSGDQWRIRYDLTEAGTNDLEQSVQAVVTNIDLTAIAAAPEEGVPLSLAGGIPGFYYTLFSSGSVADVKDRESHDANNSDKLCNADGVVTFEQVKKPSDEAGFFTVGASTEAEFTSGEEPGGGFGGFGM